MVSDIVYLKDPKTCTVYSTDRDTSGELVAVGKWDGAKILRAPREHTVKVLLSSSPPGAFSTGKPSICIV